MVSDREPLLVQNTTSHVVAGLVGEDTTGKNVIPFQAIDDHQQGDLCRREKQLKSAAGPPPRAQEMTTPEVQKHFREVRRGNPFVLGNLLNTDKPPTRLPGKVAHRADTVNAGTGKRHH